MALCLSFDELCRFPDAQGKLYTAEIVLAFAYLHNLNVVYRDLKPEVTHRCEHTEIPPVEFLF